ncbi:MAG: TadE/TadG family type IV pilus assembly protein [Pseudomonadota bacterium]
MAVKAPKALSWLKRFVAARRGATAVEFAFVATPFLMLIFGVFELGLVFLVSTTLENATDTVSRRIRTGEFQTAGGTKATFKSSICAEMTWLASECATKLYVDVRTFPKFSNVTVTPPATDAELKTEPFTEGGPEDIVVVRTYYQWELFSPLMNKSLESIPGSGTRLISSTATFRNEPYI